MLWNVFLYPSYLQGVYNSWKSGNLIGPPGNFCVRCRRLTALVSSHKNMDKYLLQKYQIYRHQMFFSSSRCTKTRFRPGLRPGPLWGSLWRSRRFLFGWGELKCPYCGYFVGISALRRRPKQGKHVLDFLQRVSIACYAERCISHDRFCPTVWPSVCHTLVSCQNDSSYDHAVFTGG